MDELDCLDLLIWLQSGANSGSRLALSQSQVSRKSRQVAQFFGVSLLKRDEEWQIQGDSTLLNLERRVHQDYRWRMGRPLRLDAQYYSGPLFCDPAPQEWIVGNFDFLDVHAPLRHLRDALIDAWIGCYPDVPDPDDADFACFHLTRLPAHLVVSPHHPLVQLGGEITLDDVRLYPSLALPDGSFPKVEGVLRELGLWNLPVDSGRYSRERWEGRVERDLVVGYASALSMGFFETPQVILPLSIPLEVGDTLVVRREFANHPRLLSLLSHLKWRALELSRNYSEVTVAFD